MYVLFFSEVLFPGLLSQSRHKSRSLTFVVVVKIECLLVTSAD